MVLSFGRNTLQRVATLGGEGNATVSGRCTAVALHETRIDTTKRVQPLPQRPSYFFAHSAKI
jgi:hypothetical protein